MRSETVAQQTVGDDPLLGKDIMTRGLMRSVIAGAVALVLAVVMAGGSLPLLTGTANAAPPQDGVYQINRPIFSDSTWTLTLTTITASNNTLSVAVLYQNNSAADQGLYCPDTKQSLLVNGQTVTELTSYCAQHIGLTWTVPPKGTMSVTAVFPTLPDQSTVFTLNNWYNWGAGVANIQLVPFFCLGAGTSCNGAPAGQPAANLPNPPAWLTNLSENDLLMCTISMVALAATIVEAKALVSGAEVAMPVMVKAIEDLSDLGDFDTFLKTLQSDPYWNAALLKATANYFYEPFRACFMGVQGALQGTAGAAGKAVGQWLRSVLVTPQTSGGGGAG